MYSPIDLASTACWPLSTTETTAIDLPAYPCQDPDHIDLWFAEQGSDVERAKAMCSDCPIRRQCLAGALERGEPWGVWGGEVLIDGKVAARKRGRGRPRKSEQTTRETEAA